MTDASQDLKSNYRHIITIMQNCALPHATDISSIEHAMWPYYLVQTLLQGLVGRHTRNLIPILNARPKPYRFYRPKS